MKTFQCLFEVMNCWFSPYILLLLNDKFKIWPRVCKKISAAWHSWHLNSGIEYLKLFVNESRSQEWVNSCLTDTAVSFPQLSVTCIPWEHCFSSLETLLPDWSQKNGKLYMNFPSSKTLTPNSFTLLWDKILATLVSVTRVSTPKQSKVRLFLCAAVLDTLFGLHTYG